MLLEFDREADGRLIADVPALRGVMAYGKTHAEARAKVAALALRVLADRLEHGEAVPADALALSLQILADQIEGEEPAFADMGRFSSRDVTAWPACKAGQVSGALAIAGWAAEPRRGYSLLIRRAEVRFQEVSGRVLPSESRPSDYVFPFCEEELGPRMLARIARRTGLKPENLPRPSAKIDRSEAVHVGVAAL